MLDFGNKYVKTNHGSDIVLMGRSIRELQDNQHKEDKMAQDMLKKFAELSLTQNRLIHPSAGMSSPNQVLLFYTH